MKPAPSTNFAHLAQHDEQLVRLGMLAERYFAEDPNTCLLKLRQLGEALAQLAASRVGIYTSPDEKQYDLLRRLQDHGILPREVAALFGELRREGNAATHNLAGDHRAALTCLRISWQLGVWFHRTFKDAGFRSGPFVPPAAPKDESAELKAELDRLREELQAYRASHKEATDQLALVAAKVQQTAEERQFWEDMAAEAERAKAALVRKLDEMQASAAAQPAQTIAQYVAAASTAADALDLDEADTRKLIDEQLRAAGWTVDSQSLTYAKGARPERGKNLAIAEWPGTPDLLITCCLWA